MASNWSKTKLMRAEREVGSGSEGFGGEDREEKGLGVRRR